MGKLRSQGLSAPQGKQVNKIAKRKANLIRLQKRDANRRQIKDAAVKAYRDARAAKLAAAKEQRRVFEQYRYAYYDALDTAHQWQNMSERESVAALEGLCDVQKEYLEAVRLGVSPLPTMVCTAQLAMVTADYYIPKGSTLQVTNLTQQMTYVIHHGLSTVCITLGTDDVLGDFRMHDRKEDAFLEEMK